jgi:hypothetical protein
MIQSPLASTESRAFPTRTRWRSTTRRPHERSRTSSEAFDLAMHDATNVSQFGKRQHSVPSLPLDGEELRVRFSHCNEREPDRYTAVRCRLICLDLRLECVMYCHMRLNHTIRESI